MTRLIKGLLWAACAYAAGSVLGYLLVMALSSNAHDRAVEAAMTGAFVLGPFCALIAFIVGVLRRPRPASATSSRSAEEMPARD